MTLRPALIGGQVAEWIRMMRSEVKILIGPLLTVLLTMAAWAAPHPRFRVFELGTVSGGLNSRAYAINSRGDVLGVADDFFGRNHVFLFLYSANVLIDLGPEDNSRFLSGYDLNDSGQYLAPVASEFFPRDSVPLSAGTTGFFPFAINNSGAVSGVLRGQWGGRQTFLYADGNLALIGSSVSSHFIVRQMNNRGQMVGSAALPGNVVHAALYSDGQTIDLPPLAGDDESFGMGINDSGDVVGQSVRLDIGNGTAAQNRGFVYRAGTIVELPMMPAFPFCVPLAVNNYDEIVGVCSTTYTSYGEDQVGFAVLRDDLYDVNTLTTRRVGTIKAIFDINEAGWMVGYRQRRGVYRAILLKPTVQWRRWRDRHATAATPSS